MVCISGEENTLTLLDGQQRLATAIIFFSAPRGRENSEMAYIVQVVDFEGVAISTTVADRKQAPLPSSGASQGRSGIKIIGDGRIYTAKELARAIIDD